MKEESKNLISLTFIINGKEEKVEKVNINQPLKVSVQKALNQSGDTGRSLSDWQVNFENVALDITKKIEELGLTSDSIIFLSLKGGEGGTEKCEIY